VSDLTLQEKIEQNVWDNLYGVLPAILEALTGRWTWVMNTKCKYIMLRIDMRDGGCILSDRGGNRISVADLLYQYKKEKDDE
jgi:hypothetical protein